MYEVCFMLLIIKEMKIKIILRGYFCLLSYLGFEYQMGVNEDMEKGEFLCGVERNVNQNIYYGRLYCVFFGIRN